MIIHSSFPDFLLFLYLHVTQSDNRYDPREIALVKDKMKNLFPEGVDIEKKLYQAIREYNNFDRNRVDELIRDSVDFFNKDKTTIKSKLYADVRAIIRADGKVLKVEKDVFESIKRIVERA